MLGQPNLQVRRRAIAPGFHRAYLAASVAMFGRCTERVVDKLEGLAEAGGWGLGVVMQMGRQL